MTDASLLGWGGPLDVMEIRGMWALAEVERHIHLLELRVIRLALKAFLSSSKVRMVQVLMDKTTAMWYCKKQGGWSHVPGGTAPLDVDGMPGDFPGSTSPARICKRQSV